MTFKETTAKKIFDKLKDLIEVEKSPEENKSKLYMLLEDRLGLTKTAIASNQPVIMRADEWQQLESDVKKLKEGVPIQHVLGKAWFYGHEFIVNKHVLIPRPETEELVDLIIKESQQRKGLKILDIGTGSGCIPISLKLGMPEIQIYGMDVSDEALKVARENAECLQADVNFIHQDIFNEKTDLQKVDILVSNPPYVPESEKKTMQKEVLLHDPHLALFVADDNPLVFYKRIADIGKDILNNRGKLYFEIHEKFGGEVVHLLKEEGFQDIRLIKDIHNKDRIVTAIK